MSRSRVEAGNEGHDASREPQARFLAHASSHVRMRTDSSACVAGSPHSAMPIKPSVLLPIYLSQPLISS